MLRTLYEKLLAFLEIKQNTDITLLEFHAEQVELEKQPLPLVLRLTLYAVVGMVAVALIWATVAKVDKVVVAPGKIVSTAQTIRIQPLEVSIIKKFEVEIGQIVKEGQVLLRLDSTFSQADAQRLASRKKVLSLQVARLEAELKHQDFIPGSNYDPAEMENQLALFKGRTAEYEHRVESYSKSINELTSALASSEQQHQENAKQLVILQEIEGIYEGLYRKKIQSRADFLNATFQKAAKQSDVSRLKNEIEEKKQGIARVQSEKNAFFSKWHNDILTELATVNKEYDALCEELTKATRLHDLSVLTAPRAGVVLEFGSFSEGSVVREGEAVMTLVPLDVPLEAEVFIEPAEIGYLQVGDVCRLKLDTFPFQKHGTISGTLRTLSDDSMKIEGQETPKYKGRVAFDAVQLSNVPSGFRLLPGMSLRSEIKVGTRRVITFLTYPLIRTLDESMRDP